MTDHFKAKDLNSSLSFSRAPLLFPMKEEKGDPVLEQFSLEELYHMLELLDKIEADRSVDLTSSESKTFKYLLDSYVGRK